MPNVIDPHKKINQVLSPLLACVEDCYLKVRLWLSISEGKRKNPDLPSEYFLAFVQQEFIKSIAIDCFSIIDGACSYLVKIIEDSPLKKEKSNLFKKSKLTKNIELLKNHMQPWRSYRNKRFAHLEHEELTVVTCDMPDLLDILEAINNSLGYINSYLHNPQRITDVKDEEKENKTGKWEFFNTYNTHLGCSKNSQLNSSPPVKSLLELLEKRQTNHEVEFETLSD